jgi:chromosome segregation ATPase
MGNEVQILKTVSALQRRAQELEQRMQRLEGETHYLQGGLLSIRQEILRVSRDTLRQEEKMNAMERRLARVERHPALKDGRLESEHDAQVQSARRGLQRYRATLTDLAQEAPPAPAPDTE